MSVQEEIEEKPHTTLDFLISQQTVAWALGIKNLLLDPNKEMNISKINFNAIAINEKIGYGSYSVIYSGEFRGEKVAIKIVYEKLKQLELADQKKLKESFWKEIVILSQIRHRNIIRFIGFCADAEQQKFGLVTELSPLGNLSAFIENSLKTQQFEDSNLQIKPLDWILRIKICHEIVEAICYLHSQKIILRNLNLEEVLLFSTDLSDPDHIKICDFGMALNKSRSSLSANMEKITYVAPELLASPDLEECHTEKCDVFSFSFMMWQILEWQSKVEMENGGPNISMRKMIEVKLRPKVSLLFDNWSSLKSLMEKCWSEDPSNRPSFQSMIDSNVFLSALTLPDTITMKEKLSFEESQKKIREFYPPTLQFNVDIEIDTEDGFFVPLSTGSLGVIYTGKMKNGYNRDVAIKSVNLTDFNPQAELRIVRRLSHQNIIKYFGWFYLRNAIFIVMEYFPEDLCKHIEKKAPEVAWENKGKEIALKVGHAITYLHHWRILHRDIKSPNIMIRDDWSPVLIDFGIAKYQTKTVKSNTTGNTGTSRWGAPESFSSKFYFESDVYSFAVVLWELFAQDLPWKNKSDSEIGFIVANPKSPAHLPIKLTWPKEICILLKECWQFDHKKRPNIEQIISVLEEINCGRA